MREFLSEFNTAKAMRKGNGFSFLVGIGSSLFVLLSFPLFFGDSVDVAKAMAITAFWILIFTYLGNSRG